MKKYLFCISLLLFTNYSYSQMTYEQFGQKSDSEGESWKISFLIGLGQGIRYTNAYLKNYKKIELFCISEDYKWNTASYATLVDTGAKSIPNNELSKLPIEWVMMRGFVTTFPCK